MLDISVAYHRYQFLGHEFLTWLWYCIATNQIENLEIGNRIILEIQKEITPIEVLTIKGDNANLEEAVLALNKGAVVTELHLIYRKDELIWQFTIKGENFALSGVKLPENKPAKTDPLIENDIEQLIISKFELTDTLFKSIDDWYHQFIILRTSPQWQTQGCANIKKWIQKGIKQLSNN
jgi:hypothetical protein